MATPAQNMLIQAPSIQDVGRLVRDRRLALGLRQVDVADRAGLSRSRLLDLENNKPVEGLSFHNLCALLSALGLQLAIAAPYDAAEVAAHHRNAIRVPAGIKLSVPSIG